MKRITIRQKRYFSKAADEAAPAERPEVTREVPPTREAQEPSVCHPLTRPAVRFAVVGFVLQDGKLAKGTKYLIKT